MDALSFSSEEADAAPSRSAATATRKHATAVSKPSAKTKARPKRRPPPPDPRAHDAALFYDDDDDDGSETDACDSIEIESALKRVFEEKSALIEKRVALREKKIKAKHEAFAKQAYDEFKAECKAYDDENTAEAAKLDKQVRELLAQEDVVAAKSAKRIKAVIQKVEHFSHGLRKEVEKAHSSVEGARGAYDAVIGEYDSAMASKMEILHADVAACKKRRLDQMPIIDAIEGILARGKLLPS